MATQEGIFPLKGTIGNVTFVKTKGGVFLAKRKTSVDKTRIMTDPAFQRTRENLAEFGRAGKAGALLRTAIAGLLKNVKTTGMTSRMMTELIKVVKADLVNPRGLRQVLDAETEMLEGFEFNGNSKLSKALPVQFTNSIDRVTGVFEIDLPSFIPSNVVAAPEGCTHFKLVSAASAINFESETFQTHEAATAILPWDATATAAINLTNNIAANSTDPLFQFLGIQFYQEVNGSQYPLKNGLYNALSIVKVSGV
jgi:hypothetical protein